MQDRIHLTRAPNQWIYVALVAVCRWLCALCGAEAGGTLYGICTIFRLQVYLAAALTLNTERLS